MSVGEKTSRESADMDISGHPMTRHDAEAIDRNLYQAMWQTFTETVGNKDQHHG